MGNNWEYWVKEAEKQEKKYEDLHKYYKELETNYNMLKEHADCLEKYCDSLAGHCNCCQVKLETNYQNYIKQMEDKIASLIKQRDNWKADCEYNEECFQAERNRRWELEEQLNKVREAVKDDKNEFYEKCSLKVLHVDTENDIILDKIENKNLLDDFEISDSMHNCYQTFFLIDKKRARSIPFAMICGPVISKFDFKMYDNFLEEDIMFIERVINDRYPFDIKRYHIDLRYGKVYDSEYVLRLARKENKNG